MKKESVYIFGSWTRKEEEEKEIEMANVAAEWIVIGHRLGKLVLEGSTKACEEVFFFWGCRHLLHQLL